MDKKELISRLIEIYMMIIDVKDVQCHKEGVGFLKDLIDELKKE